MATKIELSARDSARLRAVLSESEPLREALALRRAHAKALVPLLLVVIGCVTALGWILLTR